jgi:hypothetical protein
VPEGLEIVAFWDKDVLNVLEGLEIVAFWDKDVLEVLEEVEVVVAFGNKGVALAMTAKERVTTVKSISKECWNATRSARS